METTLKIIDITLYGLGIFAVYYIFFVYGHKLESFLTDVFHDYPIKRLNSIMGSIVLLLLGSVLAQMFFFFAAVSLWLFLLFGAPFLIFQVKAKGDYNIIQRTRAFNVMLSTNLAITMCFGLALFFSVDNARDNIGYSLIPEYSVYYQTETVMVDYYDLGYIDEDKEIAYINTGNAHLDFVLTRTFPTIYRITVFFLFILAMFLFINIKNRYYAKQH